MSAVDCTNCTINTESIVMLSDPYFDKDQPYENLIGYTRPAQEIERLKIDEQLIMSLSRCTESVVAALAGLR